jgi:hypothetical protein
MTISISKKRGFLDISPVVVKWASISLGSVVSLRHMYCPRNSAKEKELLYFVTCSKIVRTLSCHLAPHSSAKKVISFVVSCIYNGGALLITTPSTSGSPVYIRLQQNPVGISTGNTPRE